MRKLRRSSATAIADARAAGVFAFEEKGAS